MISLIKVNYVPETFPSFLRALAKKRSYIIETVRLVLVFPLSILLFPSFSPLLIIETISTVVQMTGYPLRPKLHFQIPYVFPAFSLSDRKLSLCQFTSCVTMPYTQKTDFADLSSFKRIWEYSLHISKYCLPLESGNYNLGKPNFLCFPCVLVTFPNSLCFPWQGIVFGHFPCFPCAVGNLRWRHRFKIMITWYCKSIIWICK